MKKMKKILPLMLCMTLILAVFAPVSKAWVGDMRANCMNAVSRATAAICYNVTDSQLLFVKNPTRQVGVGSITKVLTACVASQYFKATDILTVGSEQQLVKDYASRAPVYWGEKYTFEQLVAATLIPSGCDGAYALAANTAKKASGNYNMTGSQAIEYFRGMMNAFLKSVGAKDSYFVNPDGQDTAYQHTTVEDYIKVAEYAIKNPVIASVVKNSSYTCWDQAGKKHTWYTTNSMIASWSAYYYPGACGMKTGSTPNAGGCLLTAVQKNGKLILTLVVGTYYNYDDYSERFKVTHALLNVIEPYLAARGDINCDGVKDITDARSILRIAIGLDPYADTYVADFDLDGKITVGDARIALREAIGLPGFANEE